MIAILLALSCGTELWPQKTLSDPSAATALAPAPVHATIAQLGALPRTAKRRSYSIAGTVAAIKTEADGDLHVVLREGPATIIVELPDPACAAGSRAFAAIRRARLQAAVLRVGQRVRVVGMLFMDKCHGQSGAAPRCQELHPLFSVRRLP